MKLPPARLATFLANPDAAIRATLFYGPDAGLVRERADSLATVICRDLRDAFRVADLTGAALAADPARIFDEAAALSLSGGRRVIRIRDAGDNIGGLLERYLAAPPPGDSLVVIEAAELAPRSSLRRAFENSAAAVAIACYADGKRELGELAREVLRKYSIVISDDAMTYLTSRLGGDRLASRQELEKLALFAGDRGRIGLSEAMECVGDTAALTTDDVVLAAAEGNAEALERALLRSFQEGEMPVGILRATMRHFQRLHLAGSHLASGASEEEALRSLRPPLFFKLQERFKRQLVLWPVRRAAQVLELLTQAELDAKRSGPPPETICRESLFRIARWAASRNRS